MNEPVEVILRNAELLQNNQGIWGVLLGAITGAILTLLANYFIAKRNENKNDEIIKAALNSEIEEVKNNLAVINNTITIAHNEGNIDIFNKKLLTEKYKQDFFNKTDPSLKLLISNYNEIKKLRNNFANTENFEEYNPHVRILSFIRIITTSFYTQPEVQEEDEHFMNLVKNMYDNVKSAMAELE